MTSAFEKVAAIVRERRDADGVIEIDPSDWVELYDELNGKVGPPQCSPIERNNFLFMGHPVVMHND
jgi:hypothetical protein